MGNCLVLEENVVRVMKTDGKILEYKSSMKVYEVLSDFAGYAIADKLPVLSHLKPDTKLLCGHLYYLVPIPQPKSRARNKKKVRFSEPDEDKEEKEKEEEQRKEKEEAGHGVTRIKVVITKRQLKEMLQKGVAVDAIVARQLQSLGGKAMDASGENNELSEGDKAWKPALESIAEAN